MAQPWFQLDALLDPDYLAAHYRPRKRLHIPGLLVPDGARRLFLELQNSDEWQLLWNEGEQLFQLSRKEQAALTAEQKGEFDRVLFESAREGFQFRYEHIHASDGRRKRAESARLLDKFASFMSSRCPSCTASASSRPSLLIAAVR